MSEIIEPKPTGSKLALLADIGNSTTELASVGISLDSKDDPLENHDHLDVMKIPTSELDSHPWVQNLAQFERIVCASVVPEKNSLFSGHQSVLFIDHQTIPALKVEIDHPETVGADRLVNALAAYKKFHGRCLVIDSGTATTFCMVSENGVYEGGVIYPGMGIASKALELYTAKIPLIHVKPQKDLIGKSTEQAVQIGLYHGTIQMINGMIAQYRVLYPNIHVAGTGAALELLKDKLELDSFEPNLIIEGLMFCL